MEYLDTLIWFAKAFGPSAAVFAFFIFRDWRREERLNQRICDLEKRQDELVLPLIREANDVIARNTAVIERLETALTVRQVLGSCNFPAAP